MILLLQAITRLVTLVLLAVLALAGLALAVFSVPGGESGLPRLAELIGLPGVRDEVGAFLDSAEAQEDRAPIALAGFGAALVAILLILGVVWRRRERLVTLPASEDGDGDDDGAERGRLAARRRPLAQMSEALALRVRGLTALKLRVKPRRRGPGGRLRARAALPHDGDEAGAGESIRREVTPVAEQFGLEPRVRARRARKED